MAAAPIPADADLRGFRTTPIFRVKLFNSWFEAHASDAEWRAGVTLWLKSWDQVPAGSLPNNDVELARLTNRPLKAWLRVRDIALHRWSLHNDGRLYHPVVTDSVLSALTLQKKRQKNGQKGGRPSRQDVVSERKKRQKAKAKLQLSNHSSTSSSTSESAEADSGVPRKDSGEERGRRKREVLTQGARETGNIIDLSQIRDSL